LLEIKTPSDAELPPDMAEERDPYWWVRPPPCDKHPRRPDGDKAARFFDEKERLKRKAAAGTATENEKLLLRALCHQLKDGCCTE